MRGASVDEGGAERSKTPFNENGAAIFVDYRLSSHSLRSKVLAGLMVEMACL